MHGIRSLHCWVSWCAGGGGGLHGNRYDWRTCVFWFEATTDKFQVYGLTSVSQNFHSLLVGVILDIHTVYLHTHNLIHFNLLLGSYATLDGPSHRDQYMGMNSFSISEKIITVCKWLTTKIKYLISPTPMHIHTMHNNTQQHFHL